MSSTRMAVVVRRDLQMTPGLLAAQVLHAGMMFVAKGNRQRHKKDDEAYLVEFSGTQMDWINEPYVAVLAVDTKEELELVSKMAIEEKLAVHAWHDVIPSKVFDGRVLECFVGVSIGPVDADRLRKVVGTLPLY